MKKVKAFFIVVILVMAIFVLAVLGAARSFAEAVDDGYMMPASSSAARSLNSGEQGDPVSLIEVSGEDMIYTSLGRFYVGEDHKAVDVQYPMWISGGAGLRFLDDENWLITADVNLLRTFEGLYLVDGTTYNVDRTQADAEEFILLRLKNGLYMNAQGAKFITKMQTYDIPANSLLMFSENALRWYSPNGKTLEFGEAEEVFEATIRIGDHEYDYASLLKALGLIGDAIEKLEDGKDPTEELNKAEVLMGSPSGSGGSGGGQGQGEDAAGEDESDAQQGGSSTPGTTAGSGSGEGSGATLPGTSMSSGGSQGSDDGSGTGSTGDEISVPEDPSHPGGSGGSGSGEGEATPPEEGSDPDGSGDGGGDSEEGSEGGQEPGEPSEPGEGGEPSEGDEGESGDGSGSGGSGSGQPVPYQPPQVELLDIKTWSYAVNLRLRFFDPAGAVTKGVRITAYKGLSSDAKEIGTTEDGLPIWEAKEGRSALTRKSYMSAQTLNLSPLSPNTTLYLQYSYTYIAQEEDPSTGADIRVKRTYYSDFIEVTTPTIEEGGVHTVAADWELLFAQHPDAIQLDNFTLANTTEYQPDDTSFENFKLNTLPYANRILLQCTPVDENGDPISGAETSEIIVNSTILGRAQKDGGTSFTSSNPKLDSNQRYSIKAVLRDRYGNDLPLQINGEDASQILTAYTAKQLPSVTIEETANVTDKLTLTLRVSDPDGALAKENGVSMPLTLAAQDTNGQAAVLTGTFADGTPFGDSQSKTLTLNEPEDGKEYVFTIDSLAFARTYQFSVTGDYNPQPDGVQDPSLPVEQDVRMGYARIYTASLSSGLVNFSTSVADLLDTSMTLNATMTGKTTLEILPLVDEYRVLITKEGAKEPAMSYVLSMEHLNRSTNEGIEDGSWYYDDSLGALVLQKGDALNPTVMLVADKSLFNTYTPWEALSPKVVDPDAEKIEYTVPARLQISVPKILETSTRYNVEIRSMVIKGGEEYQIPTTLSTNAFTTKKIQPKLQYADLFAAGDLLSLINTRVYDPDGTIQENGLVYVYLYYNGTLLDMERIYADTSGNGPTQTITFDGIIEGAEYELRFVAAAFNDAEGFSNYQTNYLLWSYMVEGGSSLNGNINVDSIEYASTSQARDAVVQMTGEEVSTAIADGSWKLYGTTFNDLYTTQKFDIPKGTTFLQLSNFVAPQDLNDSTHLQVLPTFYNAEGTAIKHQNFTQDVYIVYGGSPIIVVPDGAVSFTIRIPVTEEGVLRWGLEIDGYSTARSDLFQGMTFEDNQTVDIETGQLKATSGLKTSQMIPVKPGQVITWTGTDSMGAGRFVYFYTSDGGYMGYMSGYRNRLLSIPEEVGYIRIALSNASTSKYEMYVVADAVQEDGYTAALSLEVNDNNGYLSFGLPEGENPTATLELYVSDSISAPEWNLSQSWKLKLEDEDGDNKYRLTPEDAAKVLEGLAPNQSYQLVLKANYQGNEVSLDTAAFQTDGAYFVIHNQRELLEVNNNPFANYLVVEDFEQSLTNAVSNVYGTIDFQGHVVTRSGVDNSLISTIQAGGVVRNLVYDFPADSTITRGMFSSNYGTIENVIVRTKGKATLSGSSMALLVHNNLVGGTIRNFIIELNGDLTFASSSYIGSITRGNYGLIENGYMYGANGAGVMFMTNPGNQQRAGGFICENYPGGTIRNVYTLFDSWYLGGADSYAGAVAYNNYYNFSNVYHVGDFYQYVSDKSTVSPMTKERVFYSGSTASGNKDVYYISANTYAATSAWVSAAEPAVLYDQEWQQNVLGDAFDTSTIEVGFYPRLKLPTIMQKYQNYISLPVLGDSAPEIISDSWATGESELIENAGGNVSFILNNPRNAAITSLKASGLKFNIQSQKALGNGLYEVIAYVTVDPEAPQYLSSYTITELQYTSGSSSITQDIKYNTQGFEFWKTVNNAQEWSEINDHMNWNYRLTADIDFKASTLIPAAIMINGSKTNLSGTTSFTGKLDGDGHTISNISLENLSQPWVFYNLSAATSEIRNLTVENITIKAGGSVTTSRAGFVAYLSNGSMENVHIRNARISGVGYVGGLVGYVNNGVLRECSVADAVIDDGSGSYPARVGGLVGYMSANLMDRCYTRNVEIQVTSSAVIEGVGGLVGYDARAPITNCYATGSIVTSGGKAGGAVGVNSTSSAYTEHVWTDVSINATGDQVGGMSGWTAARQKGSVVFGNIFTSGEEVNRVNGAVSGTGLTGRNILVYAYEKQTVNNLPDGEISDARGLVGGTELARKSFWADKANMGAAFDYSQLSLETPGMPLILSEDGGLVEGQEWIELPGQMEPPSLRITLAEYTAGTYPYQFAAELVHPGYSSQEIIELLQNPNANNQLSIDGIDISQAQQSEGNVVVTFNEGTEGAEATTFSVQIKDMADLFTKRLDAYTLTVTYQTSDGRLWSLDATVDFEQVLYWEVPDLKTWQDLMQNGHALTGENFKITGKIDFAGNPQNVQEIGLKIGRLEGTVEGAGFYNLNYTANATTGAPWIESVYTDISNITFENFRVDFSNTGISRGVSGAIVSANDLNNCVFRHIEVLGNANTDARFGFFGQINGDIKGITLETIKLEVPSPASGGQFVGGLAGQILGSFQDVKGDGITVNAPGAIYVGGLFGTQTSNAALDSRNVELTNITVNANQYAGGLGYQIRELADVTLDGFNITATYHVGGISCNLYAGAKTNITVKNGTVTATGTAVGDMFSGGLAAYDGGYTVTLKNIRIENVDVTGNNLVGGVLGRRYNANIDGVQVIGCTITNPAAMPSVAPAEEYYYSTGGILGYHYNFDRNIKNTTVRDTTITGPYNVGGVAGTAYQTGTLLLQNVYVAEDVVVKGTGDNAGGIIGRGYLYNMTNVACGAQVSAAGSAAGGIVGRAEGGTNLIEPVLTMKSVYFAGDVYAGNYAGGLIGLMNHRTFQFEPEELDGVVVTGSVRCAGDRASLWVNSLASYNLPGDGTVMIWEDATLNGQTARAIEKGQQATNTSTFLYPEKGDLVSAASIAKEDFYQGLGFDSSWDLAALSNADNEYMPFLTDGTGSRLKDTDSYNGNPTGILLPEPGAQEETVVLYASGPDRFTIDLVGFQSEDGNGETISVKFGDGAEDSFTTDENGSMTFTTDFETPVTVKVKGISTTFETSDMQALRRNVMTWDGYWYYLDGEGNVVYGSGKESSNLSGLNPGDVPVHLWQGKILCENSSGYTVYTLEKTDEGRNAVPGEAVTVNAKQNDVAPLYSYAYGETQQIPVQVFHEYSLYNGVRAEIRLFEMGGTPYVVSPRQNVVPDGVILSRKSSITGTYTNYYGLLQTDGTLTDNRNNMQLNGLPMSGIDQISNNFGYTGNVAVIRYQGGSDSENVVVVDYSSGTILHDTRSTFAALVGYAKATISGLFNSFGNGIGDSFLESEASLGEGVGQEQVPEKVGGDGQGGDSLDRVEGDIVLGTGETSDQAGGSQGEGEAVDGSGTVQDGSGQTENGSTGSSAQEDEYQYVPGEGLYQNGTLTAQEGEYQYQPGEGLYKDGVLLYAQTSQPAAEGQAVELSPTEAAQAGSSSGAGSSAGQGSGNNSGAQTGAEGSAAGDGTMALLQALGGQVVMYSEESGRYETVETAQLLGLKEESTAQQADGEKAAEEDASPTSQEDGDLTVNGPWSQTLTAQERSGFVLMGVITLTAVGALVVVVILYRRYSEKKRSGQ